MKKKEWQMVLNNISKKRTWEEIKEIFDNMSTEEFIKTLEVEFKKVERELLLELKEQIEIQKTTEDCLKVIQVYLEVEPELNPLIH